MEEKTEAYITEMLPSNSYGTCFHPVRHMKKKIHGKWKNIREKLLPGYVFITTDDVQQLFLYLMEVPVFTKILGGDSRYFTPLSKEDTGWLEKITGKSCAERLVYETELSKVCISKENVVSIVSGPLKDMEGMIKKINLHKRFAEIETEFMNRKMVIHLGIEILGSEQA